MLFVASMHLSFIFECLVVCSACTTKTWLGRAARESPRVRVLLTSYAACVSMTLFRSRIWHVSTHFPSLIACLVGASCCFLCSKLFTHDHHGLVSVLGELCSTAWRAQFQYDVRAVSVIHFFGYFWCVVSKFWLSDIKLFILLFV